MITRDRWIENMDAQAGQVFLVLGSGAVVGGPMSEDEARAQLSTAQIEKAKSRAGKTAVFSTSNPETAAAKFGNAEVLRSMKIGDSIEQVRRVDVSLGVIEVVDRDEFEAGLEALPREDRVLAYQDPDTKFIRVDARLARTGVLRYADRDGNVWGELVDEDELFNPESMRSFEMVVLTDDHPEEFVSVENVKDVQVGHVGSDVRRDGRYLRASVLITDAAVIARAKAGKLELSCGYTAAAQLEVGVRDGKTYRFRQLRRRGNHLSIVDRGRAGPDCRLLLDSTSALHDWKESTMKKIKIDGLGEFEVEDKVAELYEANRAKLVEVQVGDAKYMLPSEVAAKIKDAFPPPTEEEEDKKDADTSELERLRGKNDALEARVREIADGETQRFDARVSLVQTAGRVLGSEFKTDGASNAAIKAAVVNKVQPDKKIDVRRTKDGIEITSAGTKVSEGYLDGLFEGAVLLHDRAEETAFENSESIFQAVYGDAGGDDFSPDAVIKAQQTYLDSRSGRKRAPAKEK